MELIQNKTFDEERALYRSRSVEIKSCRFDGPADGESAVKESEDIVVEDSFFNLRYPFWHNKGLKISYCVLTDKCRAALWYSEDIQVSDTRMHGIKALRECKNVYMRGCDISSPEFGWSVSGVRMEGCRASSEYFMMRSKDLEFKNVKLTGKYSFQYIEDAVFEDCEFDTKDAFWHAKNVTVKNSVIKGEYLAWYSENLTLENCKISGTQPLCWCKNLRLINCELNDADLCFERSEVNAVITTPVISIKNPLSGRIKLPSVGETILDDKNAKCDIIFKRGKHL